MARTREQFNEWYEQSLGDPWGYESRSIRRRLDKSASFLERFLTPEFAGTLLEFGCFQGQLTGRLVQTFPNAGILATDISDTALAQAAKRVGNLPRVTFAQGDLLEFGKLLHDSQRLPVVPLLFEVLYYLDPAERRAALQGLRERFPEAPIFISGPIIGGKYFEEPRLIADFAELGYALMASKVLTMRLPGVLGSAVGRWVADRSDLVRRRYAFQVLYAFLPKEASPSWFTAFSRK